MYLGTSMIKGSAELLSIPASAVLGTTAVDLARSINSTLCGEMYECGTFYERGTYMHDLKVDDTSWEH